MYLIVSNVYKTYSVLMAEAKPGEDVDFSSIPNWANGSDFEDLRFENTNVKTGGEKRDVWKRITDKS